MNRILIVCAVFGFTASAGIAQGAAPNAQEGMWEITSKMEMPGMPMNMPPQTMQRCVTQKDFSDPQSMAPPDPSGNKCQTSDYRMQGNTATWKIVCTGPNAMSGTGSATYSGNAY